MLKAGVVLEEGQQCGELGSLGRSAGGGQGVSPLTNTGGVRNARMAVNGFQTMCTCILLDDLTGRHALAQPRSPKTSRL